MISLYALHGFLGLPSDWDFLGEKVHALNIFSIEGSFTEWAARFNNSISSGHDNILIGYSLGGRLALHALIDQPKLWKAAIIISAHPGFKNVEDKSQRIQFDKMWAQRFLCDPWAELMQEWNNQHVFQGTICLERQESDFCRQQLANSLVQWSLGVQEDLQEAIEHLDIPLFWLTGERDVRYIALTRQMSLKHPKSRTIIIPQAGHRLPWDAPEIFKQTLQGILCI